MGGTQTSLVPDPEQQDLQRQQRDTMAAATDLLDEMCHRGTQALVPMETSEQFQVLKLLGEGSYGKVVLALHRKEGTPMALKFFPRDSTPLPSFLREYHLALRFCSHPSLTRALGTAYCTPSHYVFAQQPGLFGDLYDLIVPEVGVEEQVCHGVVSQLCGALTHLHRLGFVHRDVKPENVFLCDAACRWVKLGDFGMVKSRGCRVPEVWYSSPYCAPEAEVARGTPGDPRGVTKRIWVSVEPSTDSWALGVLTFALLTGTHPWAETASDCFSYGRYLEWFLRTSRDVEDSGVWAEPPGPKAPQFASFTPLACSFFHWLLDPRPESRGQPEGALRFLGGTWVKESEKVRRREEEQKKNGREVLKSVRETEGRGQR